MSKTSHPLTRLMSVTEFAERVGVSTKTARRWLASGDLRGHRLGRQIRISEEDVRSFVAVRRM
jgi:excisionase family DNA binding protein